jgi:uncharacterized glyoxalase superfamily protein PhnB
MQLVHFYLNFPGNTADAFRFYETVFGTKILFQQTFGDTSFLPDAPAGAREKIMHVQLPITEAVHLMGSDCVDGFGRRQVRRPVDGEPDRAGDLTGSRLTPRDGGGERPTTSG